MTKLDNIKKTRLIGLGFLLILQTYIDQTLVWSILIFFSVLRRGCWPRGLSRLKKSWQFLLKQKFQLNS